MSARSRASHRAPARNALQAVWWSHLALERPRCVHHQVDAIQCCLRTCIVRAAVSPDRIQCTHRNWCSGAHDSCTTTGEDRQHEPHLQGLFIRDVALHKRSILQLRPSLLIGLHKAIRKVSASLANHRPCCRIRCIQSLMQRAAAERSRCHGRTPRRPRSWTPSGCRAPPPACTAEVGHKLSSEASREC